MIKLISKILDFIYPPICGVCKKIDKNSLCNKCEKILKENSVFGIDNYEQDEKNFDEHLYIFMYQGIIRKMILNYKFNDRAYLYKTFVNFLLKNEKFVEKIRFYDIIIPVSLHRKREKQRGYNQSALIAEELGKNLKIPVNKECLYKTKNVIPQSSLSKEEREINIKDAYVLKNSQKLIEKKVLLIDDIYTTGNTADECSKTIKKANINKIGILTIAKD